MTTSENLDNSTLKHDLAVNDAADLLVRETQRASNAFQLKTGIKSIDSHLQNVFTSGQVVAVGHLLDEDHIVCIYHMVKAYMTDAHRIFHRR
jgi:hypothetical protein